MVIQFCTYAKWSDGSWSHVDNTATAPRCAFLKDSIPALKPWRTAVVPAGLALPRLAFAW
jgi:hypothetical protein